MTHLITSWRGIIAAAPRSDWFALPLTLIAVAVLFAGAWAITPS